MKPIALWISIFVSTYSFAKVDQQSHTHAPLIEDYSHYYSSEGITYQSFDFIGEDENTFVAEDDFKWLYELLFAQSDRLSYPKRSRKSFDVHLKDSFDNFPHPDEVLALANPLLSKQKLSLGGTMIYVGIFPRAYKYDVFKQADGSLVIEVRVHFKTDDTYAIQRMERKLRKAAEIWNRGAPQLSFDYEFRFITTNDTDEAHFSVNLVDNSRGPYDVTWALNWNANTVAHELGHMMGLGDEYQTLTGTIDCLTKSLMCHSWYGDPMEHHYYHILKRFTDIQMAKNESHKGSDDWDFWDYDN